MLARYDTCPVMAQEDRAVQRALRRNRRSQRKLAKIRQATERLQARLAGETSPSDSKPVVQPKPAAKPAPSARVAPGATDLRSIPPRVAAKPCINTLHCRRHAHAELQAVEQRPHAEARDEIPPSVVENAVRVRREQVLPRRVVRAL